MISRLRRAIALSVALLVTFFTLGRVRVNRTGRSAADGGAEDPGRASVARLRGAVPLESAPGADRTILREGGEE
jgi:hypothetical protein